MEYFWAEYLWSTESWLWPLDLFSFLISSHRLASLTPAWQLLRADFWTRTQRWELFCVLLKGEETYSTMVRDCPKQCHLGFVLFPPPSRWQSCGEEDEEVYCYWVCTTYVSLNWKAKIWFSFTRKLVNFIRKKGKVCLQTRVCTLLYTCWCSSLEIVVVIICDCKANLPLCFPTLVAGSITIHNLVSLDKLATNLVLIHLLCCNLSSFMSWFEPSRQLNTTAATVSLLPLWEGEREWKVKTSGLR